MTSGLMKSFAVAVFSFFLLLYSLPSFADGGEGGNGAEKKKAFNAQEIIFGHVLDGHDFHFFDITQSDGTKKPVGIQCFLLFLSRCVTIFPGKRKIKKRSSE